MVVVVDGVVDGTFTLTVPASSVVAAFTLTLCGVAGWLVEVVVVVDFSTVVAGATLSVVTVCRVVVISSAICLPLSFTNTLARMLYVSLAKIVPRN